MNTMALTYLPCVCFDSARRIAWFGAFLSLAGMNIPNGFFSTSWLFLAGWLVD